MRVGFNYPFAYNRFGSQIGPDIWVLPLTGTRTTSWRLPGR